MRDSAETHALHVAIRGPADRAPRPLVRPRLKETQNGSPTHNLSTEPRDGAQRGIKTKDIRHSNDPRPYMGIYARAKARMGERTNRRMKGRGEIWIIECI